MAMAAWSVAAGSAAAKVTGHLGAKRLVAGALNAFGLTLGFELAALCLPCRLAVGDRHVVVAGVATDCAARADSGAVATRQGFVSVRAETGSGSPEGAAEASAVCGGDADACKRDQGQQA